MLNLTALYETLMLNLTALYHSFVIGTDLKYRLNLIRKHGKVIRNGIARDSGAYRAYLTFKYIPDELYVHFYNTQVHNPQRWSGLDIIPGK